jgi:peptide deformylase
MKTLKVITEPNQLLHKESKKVKKFDDYLENLASKMIEIMRKNGGVGLSSVQVGKLLKMVVVEYLPEFMTKENRIKLNAHEPLPLTILVNPKITKLSKETNVGCEGCLSLPETELNIIRPNEISLIAQNIKGEKIRIRARNYLARIILHEIDHLDGILITDRAVNEK